MRPNTILDTRSFDPRAKQALIFSLFDGLIEGESFEVISELDPALLCNHLDALDSANLQWRYLEKSPRQFRLLVEKLTSKQVAEKRQGGCCGMCGG